MIFKKHLRSVSREASQRLGILRRSWRVFHDQSLVVRCFGCFVLPVLEYCSDVWCLIGGCRCTHYSLHRVVQFCVCYIRSLVITCIHFVVHCLCFLCQCGLHVVHWSLVGIVMHVIAAESHSTSGLSDLALYLYGMILVTECSMVWDWRVLRVVASMLLLSCSFLSFCLPKPPHSLPFFYGLALWEIGSFDW